MKTKLVVTPHSVIIVKLRHDIYFVFVTHIRMNLKMIYSYRVAISSNCFELHICKLSVNKKVIQLARLVCADITLGKWQKIVCSAQKKRKKIYILFDLFGAFPFMKSINFQSSFNLVSRTGLDRCLFGKQCDYHVISNVFNSFFSCCTQCHARANIHTTSTSISILKADSFECQPFSCNIIKLWSRFAMATWLPNICIWNHLLFF